jgi:hypothetical protein
MSNEIPSNYSCLLVKLSLEEAKLAIHNGLPTPVLFMPVDGIISFDDAETIMVVVLPRVVVDFISKNKINNQFVMLPSELLNISKSPILPRFNIKRVFRIRRPLNLQKIVATSLSERLLLEEPHPCWGSPFVGNMTIYVNCLYHILELCSSNKLFPVFHYTNVNNKKLILKNGLLLSDSGQGDGGVYFSMSGPAHYGVGKFENSEENIILDCYGKERLDEFRGKGKVNMVIVVATPAELLSKVDHRENAVVLHKSVVQSLTTSNIQDQYYLTPDRICGCFDLEHGSIIDKGKFELALETEKHIRDGLMNRNQ